MPRRFNYTKRQRILREHVIITICKDDTNAYYFDARIDLKGYGFDPRACVFIEAYRRTHWMRFNYGQVGALTEPPKDQRRLQDFGHPEGVLFRLKVTQSDRMPGKLLGEADGIRPCLSDAQAANAIPLIESAPGELGSEIWRVDFSRNAPLLLLNKKLDDWRGLVRDVNFRALVAPAIMRQILTRALLINRNTGDEDDREVPICRWIQFAASLPGVGEPPEDLSDENAEKVADWIDTAVESFCQRAGLFNRFQLILGREA